MQECTDMAENHQMRERLEFYHHHPPSSSPTALFCWGRYERRSKGEGEEGWGGLSIPLTLLSSPLLSKPFTRLTGGQCKLTVDLSLLLSSIAVLLSPFLFFDSFLSLCFPLPTWLLPLLNIHWCNKGGFFSNRCTLLRKSGIHSLRNRA